LEFLGDALVNCVCAELLFQQLPKASEGELTRIRANLVDEASLAEFARQLDLSDALIMGGGELKSGGYRRESILADVFEALCAAIYLDHGTQELRRFVEPFLLAALSLAQQKAAQKDAKTQLQEWLQDRARALPSYQLLEATGQDHNRHFLVQCQVAATEKYLAAQSLGRGSSLKRAEQNAALAMLAQVQPQPLSC
jgi:ribonuclease III